MQQQTFQRQQSVYNLLWNIIQDAIKHYRRQPTTLENMILRTKANNYKSKMTRTNNIMKKRKNIETRGFDTNAYVSYKQSLNKKQTKKIISLMTENKNKDGPETDIDEMYTTAYQDHLDELKITEEYFSKLDKENLTPENLEILFLSIVNFDRGIRDYDVLKKRENIETRGYDTNATITRKAYQMEELALEHENATETENPPVLIHLHHDIQEYEQTSLNLLWEGFPTPIQ